MLSRRQVGGVPAKRMHFACFLAATGSCQAMQEARVEPVLQQELHNQIGNCFLATHLKCWHVASLHCPWAF